MTEITLSKREAKHTGVTERVSSSTSAGERMERKVIYLVILSEQSEG